jgi:hypothetical protein
VADSIEQLSFELTVNALSEQERALSGLRARAGTVLAAASIAGSFLGAKTGYDPLDVWGILAMISFVLCVGSSIWVLLPHALVFAFRGDVLLAESDQREMQAVAEAYRTAGIWIEPHLKANSNKIVGVSNWLTVSCVLLVTEVILWTISLIG